jgi:hypothetical protein
MVTILGAAFIAILLTIRVRAAPSGERMASARTVVTTARELGTMPETALRRVALASTAKSLGMARRTVQKEKPVATKKRLNATIIKENNLNYH